MQAHPIADLFPPLQGEEYEALVRSIRDHGFDPNHPIVLLDGMILDGRNRWSAAQSLGLSPPTRVFAGGNPWAFVWRENATRRHLEPFQRQALAVEFIRGGEGYEEEQRERRKLADKASPPRR